MYSNPLDYTSYGKPNPSVFKNAENVLMQVAPLSTTVESNEVHPFKTLYMIGDNPHVDINGARQVFSPANKFLANFPTLQMLLDNSTWFMVAGGTSLVLDLDEDGGFQREGKSSIISRGFGTSSLKFNFMLYNALK